MGCCSSTQIPTFPSKSIAIGILPETHDNYGFDAIFLIPQQGSRSANVAVYMPNDPDMAPSYFFGPAGGKFKLFKVEVDPTSSETIKKEMAVIKSGWQNSDTETTGDMFGIDETEVTNSATKTMTVETNDNGIEKKVKVAKTYERDTGTSVELDSGFTLNMNEEESCYDLRRDGMIVAKIFDPSQATMMEKLRNEDTDMSELMQRPAALLLSDRLSLNEKIQIMTIAATANDRLIRTAMLDVADSTTSNDPYYNDPYHNNYHHSHGGNYDNGGGYNGNDNGGGGGGGDDWGDDGGDDWGGGGDE